jgi:hypothetical protein
MRIEVYKCRFTGQIFEKDSKSDYITHLKNLRERFKDKRKDHRIKQEFNSWFSKEKEKILSPDDIPQWILANQKHLMKVYNLIGTPRYVHKDKFYPKTDEITELKFSLAFDSKLSNTHSCPKGGVTNWGGDPKLPRGYPGYGGRLYAKLKRDKKHMCQYPLGDFFTFFGISTGTGGGGNSDTSYDIEIFLADWPRLGEELIAKKLKGK